MDNVLELDPIPEGATSRDHGILELNAGEADAEIGAACSGCRRSGHREPSKVAPEWGGHDFSCAESLKSCWALAAEVSLLFGSVAVPSTRSALPTSGAKAPGKTGRIAARLKPCPSPSISLWMEFSARRAGASASVSTRPMAWVGALMPSSDAKVTAKSTGSACVR